MSLVFMYGTLMRGGCRSAALAYQKFVGTGRTEPRYRLYDCGEYPGLVEAEDGRAIEGEVWRVSPACLDRLDEIEGVVDGWYARRSVALQAPFADQSIEVYLFLGNTSQLPDAGERWINT